MISYIEQDLPCTEEQHCRPKCSSLSAGIKGGEFDKDYETAVLKLDCAERRLERWGDSTGFPDAEAVKKAAEREAESPDKNSRSDRKIVVKDYHPSKGTEGKVHENTRKSKLKRSKFVKPMDALEDLFPAAGAAREQYAKKVVDAVVDGTANALPLLKEVANEQDKWLATALRKKEANSAPVYASTTNYFGSNDKGVQGTGAISGGTSNFGQN